MTSGLTSYGSGKSEIFFRSWSGADGKSEVVDTGERLKWNNYTSTFSRYSPQLGPTSYVQDGQSFPTDPVFASFGEVDVDTFPARNDFKLQSKLVRAIKGHSFNLAVSAAQGHQTLDLVLSNARKIGNSLILLKRGRFRDAADLLRAKTVQRRRRRVEYSVSDDVVGRQWLELQYGWMPLLQDSASAAEAFAAQTRTRRERVVVKGSYTVPLLDYSASPPSYTWPGSTVIRKQIVYEMTESLSTARELGLLDPLSVAWELIPYSFVLDWFIPIGTYFENLAILPSLDGRTMSTVTSIHKSRYGAPKGNYPWLLGQKRIYTRIKISRTVSTGLNTRSPPFSSLPQALSPRRLFSALALFQQKLRS